MAKKKVVARAELHLGGGKVVRRSEVAELDEDVAAALVSRGQAAEPTPAAPPPTAEDEGDGSTDGAPDAAKGKAAAGKKA